MSEVITDDVVVTKGFVGLAHMQVCAYAEVPPEQVEIRANHLNPAGTNSGWTICWGKGGEDNWADPPSLAPVPCADHPGRIHYMLSC